jgi:hypothetical protein
VAARCTLLVNARGLERRKVLAAEADSARFICCKRTAVAGAPESIFATGYAPNFDSSNDGYFAFGYIESAASTTIEKVPRPQRG